MDWDGVQRAAKRNGYLVFAMDQAQTQVVTQPGPWGNAHTGYCLGCVVRWVALRYFNTDYGFDTKTAVLEMPDWQTTRDQNIYEDTKADFPDDMAPVYGQYGLTLNRGQVKDASMAVSGAFLKSAATTAGCYHIMIKGAHAAHGIAMQRLAKGEWRLFDANYGEFRAKDAADFVMFADWYLQSTNYKAKYDKEAHVIGINPPPYVGAIFGAKVRTLMRKSAP